MNTVLQKLKRSLTQAINDSRLGMREFQKHRDWKEFLLDANDHKEAPHELAAYALDNLCEGDLPKVDGVVCLGVINFLCCTCFCQLEVSDLPEFLEDLHKITIHPASYDAYLQWIRARF